MFSITFRRRNRQADPDRLRIVSNDDQCSDGKPRARYPLDDELPALFEASFNSISSSSSSDDDDDTLSTSTSSSRRVSFLLKQEEETGPIQKGSKIKKARSPSMLRRRGKTKSTLQHNESIKSSKLLLSGEIPLAKIVLVEDTSETSTTTSPGSRLWMVGTLPEAAPPAILPIDEDLPFDEMAEQKEQDALGPFDEQASCHCCTRGGATTCVACTQVKVEDQGEGRWKVGNDEQQVCISLPAGTDLDAELPRDLVIEQHSELTMEDVYFCIDDKNIPKWTVESLLLVLFQMVVLKVSSSI